MGTPAGRVIFFGTIPTTIPDNTPMITLPITQIDTTVIPTEIPITAPTIPPSADYTQASPDYSPASETESPVIPRRRVMILAHGQPIPNGRPYRYLLKGLVHMMIARKRVGPLPVQQHAVRHSVNHSSSDYFSLDDSARDSSSDSSSEASSNFHSDASSDSSSRHLLSDHSSPNLPSTFVGPSRKRRRSPMTSVPAFPPVSGALSPVRADLIPSPKRIRDSGYLADVEVDPRETSLRDDVIVKGSDEPHLEQDIDLEVQAEIDECFAYTDALKDRVIDARVVVKAVDRVESGTGARGLIKVRVERVTHPVMLDEIPEHAQEGAVEVTYETLVDLVQRFHDHTEAISIHRIQVIEGVQKEQGHRIVRVESIVTALTERIAELEKDNRRLRGTASVENLRKMPNTRSRASRTHGEIEDLIAYRVAEEIEAREAVMNLEPLNENGDEQEGGNGNGENEGNGNGGNGGNGNGGNGNGGNGENGNGNRNMNHGMNYGGFMPVARECTFQDFLKCKPQNFSRTEGVVGLTRWFEKTKTVLNIGNHPSKYQVKYVTCTLQDSALTWSNTRKRTIGVDVAYAMNWAGLMRLMTEVYCPRNEIQKMETELWNLMVKGNDLTAYTQRF
ncbi:putative reverse transcriptase domain-containing protein [Tanacetum coccineum]